MITEAAESPPSPQPLTVTEEVLCAWVGQADPGAAVEYHRGHLAVDRAPGLSPFGEKARRELGAVADRALSLAGEGLLLLVQERHAEGDSSYFAIKPRKPAPPLVATHVAGAGTSDQPLDQHEHALGGA